MKLFIFMSKVNMGTLPSTHNTFSVLLESTCHVKALITNCDKSQIATIVSQFVTVAILWRFKTHLRLMSKVPEGILPSTENLSHRHRTISRRFPWYIDYGHYDWYTLKHVYQWNNTKRAKMQIFIFMSKMNLGTLPSTENTFLVLLDTVCAVTALITNCYKSQIATAGSPDLSQFVTVTICDGSKHNCSD